MKSKLKKALELAYLESRSGHNVLVLVPDISWVGDMTSEMSDVYGSVYTRCTTRHSDLKAIVTIDTLILVAPDDPAWDAKGEAYARERLRTSLDSLVIKVGEKP